MRDERSVAEAMERKRPQAQLRNMIRKNYVIEKQISVAQIMNLCYE